ncbi:isoaspartyl peptidase/L-asparaginase [Ideonella sp. BN130291]|uniref:isoaspartyl peptidase/L-asparaginase n=1 Tax=Ideonella sp. BN130291 TaxID=3112940 RepID=UPI002E253686|nr:isoaspartyl peptidase/L-asparaginase [Ideonella sp. BN130291]
MTKPISIRPQPMVVTHGGSSSDPDTERDGCEAGARAGLRALQGADALAAVVAAVSVLEADGRYNAGRGALLGMDGKTISCDASVMDSRGKLGAVANLLEVMHPVQVARRVADTPHHLIVGEGALQFAKKIGLHHTFEATQKAIDQYKEEVQAIERAPDQSSSDAQDTDSDDGKAAIKRFWNFSGSWQEARDRSGHCTVGAVARDADGHFAAAVSTGGSMPALLGRVADSPLIGCGFYAGRAGAIACTGIGEHILRHNLALRIYLWIEGGMALREAMERGVELLPEGVEIGLIGITRDEAEVVARKPMAHALAGGLAR